MSQRKLKNLLVFALFSFVLYGAFRSVSKSNFHTSSQTFDEDGIRDNGFKYILNPGSATCGIDKGDKITLIAMVLTRADSFRNRKMIRSTWASSALFPKLRAIFILGTSYNKTLENLIKEESELYGDIVQEDYLDTYRNLTLKTISGIKWVSKFCSAAKFVLKVDDDMLPNSYQLLKYLDEIVSRNAIEENNWYCKPLINNTVIRIPNVPLYVSKEDWEPDVYPPYCQGILYMFPVAMAPRLYDMSFKTKFMPMEDVFMGILGGKIGAGFHDTWKYYYYDWYNEEEQRNGWRGFPAYKFDDYNFVFLKSNKDYIDTLPIWSMLLKRYYEREFGYTFINP